VITSTSRRRPAQHHSAHCRTQPGDVGTCPARPPCSRERNRGNSRRRERS